MREKKSSESRRNLLKSITAGGGAVIAGKTLPESWSRPVVDSVLLPAHAQTSPTSRTFFGPATVVSIGSRDRNDSTLFADIYRMLVNDAYADGPPPPGQSNGTILAIENGDSVDVTFQNRKNTVRRRGSLLKDGTTGSLAEEDKGANGMGDYYLSMMKGKLVAS